MHRTIVLLAIAIASHLHCKSDPPAASYQTDNLVAFSRLYGYVRYFHPSDAGAGLDWGNFALYGSSQVIDCRTAGELERTLQRLFRPIAPGLVIGSEDAEWDTAAHELSADTTYTFWQHRGVGLASTRTPEIYESKRVLLRDGELRDSLFDHIPDTPLRVEPLGRGLVCRLPLVLSMQAAKDSGDSLLALTETLAAYSFDVRGRSSRLGNVINAHNVFQHFYPYFDVVDVDWQLELRKAIDLSLTDSNEMGHLNTLRRMTATVEDGHVRVAGLQQADYYPPIYWEWIQGTLVITKVIDTTLSLDVGDVVTAIDGQSTEDYFENIWPTISAGTQGWLEYRSQTEALAGPEHSGLTITTEGQSISLNRFLHPQVYYSSTKLNDIKAKVYEDDVLYVNLNNTSMNELDSIMPLLDRSAGLIFDLRGYPKRNHEIINHLMSTADTTNGWMRSPQTIYPNREGSASMQRDDWRTNILPEEPHLGGKPNVLLTDGRAISYAESFTSYIEGYNLATIVGQPTAGTNGNVNTITLPGGYGISFTGMQVVKHDGSQLHGVGFAPDIYVERSVAAVRQGRDEYIEAALKFLKAQE